jgi:hypothetical protein
MKWVNSWGDEFDNEKDARRHAKEHMDWDSYKEELQYNISYDKLLEWARNQESFWNDFQDEVAMAEEEFFSNNYDVE